MQAATPIYLAAFHAAQAIIRARTGRISKTHRGVHRLMANFGRSDPQLADLARFLSQSYNLKSVADYELGPGADVPLDRASEAVERVAQFIEQIAELLT